MKRHVLTVLLLCVALCLSALAMAEGDTRQKIDIVFLVDTTGTMPPKIARINKQMDDFAAKLPNTEFDVRYGLAGFGDETSTSKFSGLDYPEVTKKVRLDGSDWTSDVSRLKAYLGIGPDKLPKYHGGDTPETSTNAVYDVATGYVWREDALRFIILVTDAPPQAAGDYGVIGGRHVVVKSMNTVIEKCKELNISVSVASLPGDYGNSGDSHNTNMASAYGDLVQQTGGKYQYIDGSNTIASIGEWVRSYPVVSMTPETVDAGQQVSVLVTFKELNDGNLTNHHYQKKMPSEGSQWENLTDNLEGKYIFTSSAEESPDGTRFRWMGYINGTLCYSNEVTLSLFDIKTDPTSRAVDAGADVDFTVEATGDIAGFQWQKKVGDNWTSMTDGNGVSGATTKELTLSGVQLDDSVNYRCVATSKRNTMLESGTATLSVFDITTQPESTKSAEVGATVTLLVAASGDVKSYQWEKEVNGSWTVISGATGATLQLSNVMGSDAGSYRCVITSERKTTATSNAAVLTVLPALAFTTNPTDALVESGKTASFAVQAAGDGVTYQWQRKNPGSDWTDMTGATGATLELGAVSEGDDGSLFRCVAKSSLGTVKTSTEAKLTVVSAPAITLQPQSLRVAVGQDASFTIEATGYDLRYQWQARTENGFVDCPDGQTPTLTLKARKLADDGSVYRCVVRSGFGTELVSDEVTLSVLALPDLPETGDSSRLGLWAALCAACVLGLAALKRRA